MNILVETLPETLKVNGRDYPIRTDFKVCLMTILAFEDPELVGFEKSQILLRNLYVKVPSDHVEALKQANWFMNGGTLGVSDPGYNPRTYSFQKDAGYIYSAFNQTHHVDLNTVSMHWWKFITLFMDLGSDTAFCHLVGLRKRLKTGKATKEEKQLAFEMEDIIDLPELDTRTLEEKEAARAFFKLTRSSHGRNV